MRSWNIAARIGQARHAVGAGWAVARHLGFRSLDPADRAAWRVLLEHYVFNDEDPAAHILEQARSVLGTLTPERVALLKEMIRRYL